MAEEKRPSRQATTIHDISDDTLEVILLRVPSPVVLIRAAATCKLWRRVIGDAGFLRRFRRRNGPYVLGHHVYYSDYGGRTAFNPLPAAAAEIAIIGGISYRTSLDFPPSSSVLHDSCGGLLASSTIGSLEINVCCPWTLEQKLFVCPTTSACGAAGEFLCPTTVILGAFFLNDPDDTPNMSNFRILCVGLRECRHDGRKATVVQIQSFVYAATDNSCLQLGAMAVSDITQGGLFWRPSLELVGRAGGSICWCPERASNVVLHLDESSGEFSRFTLPGHARVRYNRMNLRVIGGDAGTVHLVRIAYDELEVLRYARGGSNGGECVVERRIRVPQMAIDEQNWGRWYYFSDTEDAAAPWRIIVLCDIVECDDEYVWMFSADEMNIELQRVQKSMCRLGGRAFPYELPWTICVCL
ncbi:unnamed protein product [Urochloa decumbens]|uniref:F-box domain-containing protein n=1 Tax=Urochloa decumbens TaxID=240449 RepID=A0ABC8WAE2_9POAL